MVVGEPLWGSSPGPGPVRVLSLLISVSAGLAVAQGREREREEPTSPPSFEVERKTAADCYADVVELPLISPAPPPPPSSSSVSCFNLLNVSEGRGRALVKPRPHPQQPRPHLCLVLLTFDLRVTFPLFIDCVNPVIGCSGGTFKYILLPRTLTHSTPPSLEAVIFCHWSFYAIRVHLNLSVKQKSMTFFSILTGRERERENCHLYPCVLSG